MNAIVGLALLGGLAALVTVLSSSLVLLFDLWRRR